MRPGAIQIAGVRDAEEAALLVDCGVDQLAFPLGPGVREGDCSAAEAARIVASLPPGIESALITYLSDPAAIAKVAGEVGVGWVQLHGAISPAAVAELRRLAPKLRLIKSLVVRGGDAADLEKELDAFAPHVDAFLTDTFDPATGARGATGRTHDWEISRRLAAASPRPLILAGGLTPDNVGEAIRRVRPAAVDAHTGVEGPDGRKCRHLVERFVAQSRAAFAALADDTRRRRAPPSRS